MARPRAGSGKASPVVLFYWFLFASLVPNAVLSVTEHLSLMQSATNMLLPGGCYWLAMSLARNPGKPVLWMLPITFLCAFETVLLDLYGRSVIAVDMWLNLVTTNATEVGELLFNLIPILCLVAVLYLIPLIMACISLVRKWRVSEGFQIAQRKCASLVLAAGIITFILSFFAGSRPFRPLNDIFPINAVTNCVIALHRDYESSHYKSTSRDYRHYSVSTLPDSVPTLTIVVIGETSRATNWQLSGYERLTTPRLAARDSSLVYFPRTLTESNTTHKSVPMLLTALDASSFGDSINYVTGVISAFKEAGYATHFHSAQQPNGSYIDFIGEEADVHEFLISAKDADHMHGGRDKMLIERLRKALRSGNRHDLVVLHTYGSHFNYGDRYPAAMAQFRPDQPLEAEPENRANLINAYDNSILRTDSILDALIGVAEESGRAATLIYTSDHGEDIYDDHRKLFLHASPVPSYWQLHVPMLVWVSDEMRALRPELMQTLRHNAGKEVSSSRSFYHTILDLGGVITKNFNSSAAISSPDYSWKEWQYLNDHNESVSLEGADIDPEDFEMLRNAGFKTAASSTR